MAGRTAGLEINQHQQRRSDTAIDAAHLLGDASRGGSARASEKGLDGTAAGGLSSQLTER